MDARLEGGEHAMLPYVVRRNICTSSLRHGKNLSPSLCISVASFRHWGESTAFVTFLSLSLSLSLLLRVDCPPCLQPSFDCLKSIEIKRKVKVK